jgi:hypothetical protein
MEKMNPECVAALGNVQTAGDQIKYLPRFCRLYDLPKTPGLFLPESAPSNETLRQWRKNGTLVMVKIGTSLFVDLHMTLKKNKIDEAVQIYQNAYDRYLAKHSS